LLLANKNKKEMENIRGFINLFTFLVNVEKRKKKRWGKGERVEASRYFERKCLELERKP